MEEMVGRRKWMGWLMGPFAVGMVKAQQADPAKACWGIQDGKEGPVACDPIGWKNYKAINGQCPVCGTRAKSIHISVIMHSDIGGAFTLPVRCQKCNAAFWQDAS